MGVVIRTIGDVVKEQLPKCILWEYSEENLLPAEIEIEAFIENPDVCIPLRRMFALAGYSDPKLIMGQALGRPNGLRNLLRRVSELSTKHMHSIWKDYKGIKLQLVQNGTKIDAHVEDVYNTYSLSRRSEGFKRFMVFLLLVSATAQANELTNTLYLHDEPDIGLHPSATRYVRDELIKISADNYVVYSTHSIFMIDREEIGRHLIVKRNEEVTEVSEASASNIVDEEVIYNALGYSIFENLRPKNIIFEGWRDKKLFQFAVENLPATHSRLATSLSAIGLCHVKGVKDVLRVTPLLELAGRKCLIISDGDKVAKEQQKAYEGHGTWLRYDELTEASIVTAEDFIKPKAFRSWLQFLMAEHPSLPEFNLEAFTNSQSRLMYIQSWLETNGIDKSTSKALLNQLKGNLILYIKVSDLEPSYFLFLEALAQQLEVC